MAAETSSVITLGQPSSSYTAYMEGVNNRQRHLSNGIFNEQPMTNGTTTDYYPYPGVVDDAEELELPVSVAGGNWGKKSKKGSRWVRRGKAAAWGPSKDEWEVCTCYCYVSAAYAAFTPLTLFIIPCKNFRAD